MIACIKLPEPDPKPSCYRRGFTTILHERKAGKVLVDMPINLGPGRLTERRWVSEKWVAWTL